jgi:PIN domain nuclease of toxin-antitoxin system
VIALLDTHSLLWSIYNPSLLSRTAVSFIDDPTNELLVSAATAWEIATKVRSGRMPQAERLERNFLEAMAQAGYRLRGISVEDGLKAGRLVGLHKDPFDRMIAAQALADDIPVISVDAKLDLFGVRRIW